MNTKITFFNISLFLLATFFCHSAYAQLELSAFTATGRGGAATTFATDYQAVGVNPANLGVRRSFRDPELTFGFAEFNASFFSEGLTRGELFETIFSPIADNFNTYAEKKKAAEKFANKTNAVNVDFMLAGVAWSHPKWGGIAFSVRDRIQFNARLSTLASEIMFLGANAPYFPTLLLNDDANTQIPNDSRVTPEQRALVVAGFKPTDEESLTYGQVMNGTRFSMSWYREYNMSLGAKVFDSYNFSAHAGVGVKYLQGIGLIDINVENNQFTNNTISLSPTFGLGQLLDGVPTPPDQTPNFEGFIQGASSLNKFIAAKPVGSGFAMDLGLNLVVRRRLFIGVAVTNLGQLNWENNTYRLNNSKLREVQGLGLNNYNILGASTSSFRLAGDGAALQLEGSSPFATELPSVIRVGTSYEYFRTFHVGLDVVIPRNNVAGNLRTPLYTLGGEYRLTKFIRLSSGISVGGNQGSRINIPAGIVFEARKRWFEMGIATRDIISYFINESGGTTVSFSAGFIRFKISRLKF
jgi:hypothetical protein